MPSTRLYAADARTGDGEFWVRAELRSISTGIALLAFGFALGLEASPAGFSIFGPVHLGSFDFRSALALRIPDGPPVRVASLDADVAPEIAIDEDEGLSESPAPPEPYASIVKRLLFDPSSFGRPSVGAFIPTERTPEERRSIVSLAPPDQGPASIRRAIVKPAPKLASLTMPNVSNPPADTDNRTAIYDIAAHTVYLPNGQRLEAHSGLGRLLDDPRHVDAKDRGATPPNVYDLALREELFHGVRALRLIPVGEGKMFGRDGILAHSYMLGPNGQSNGCVSFNDYPAFLKAYLRGDIQRLVVVEHLDNVPSPKTASGWLPDSIQALFKGS